MHPKPLFPRSNPQNTEVDEGKVRGGSRCPHCEGPQYVETASLELCVDCGLFTDYWSNTEELKNHPELKARAELFTKLQKEIQCLLEKFTTKNNQMLTQNLSLNIKSSQPGRTITITYR